MASRLTTPSTLMSSTAVDAAAILVSLLQQSSLYLPESPLEPESISLVAASGSPLGVRVCASEAPSLANLRVESIPRRALPSIPLTFVIAPRRAFSSDASLESSEFTRSLLASTRIRAVLRQIDEAGAGFVDVPLQPILSARSSARPGISVSFFPSWGRTMTEINIAVTRAACVIISPPRVLWSTSVRSLCDCPSRGKPRPDRLGQTDRRCWHW